MSDEETQIAERDTSGRFIKGVSGNPAGRPLNSKNEITKAKHSLELAVRQGVRPEDIQTIVTKVVEMAKGGDLSAAKLILDKTISTAKLDDESESGAGGIRVVVENATFAMTPDTPVETVIEGEVIKE